MHTNTCLSTDVQYMDVHMYVRKYVCMYVCMYVCKFIIGYGVSCTPYVQCWFVVECSCRKVIVNFYSMNKVFPETVRLK